MIKWLKSWIKPDILSVDIEKCPCCRYHIKDEMKRRTQRECNTFIHKPGRLMFYCGQCAGYSEFLQKPDSPQLVLLRVVKRTRHQTHEELTDELSDLQAQYNVALAEKGITSRPPDVTDFARHSWPKLHLAQARLKRNLKKL